MGLRILRSRALLVLCAVALVLFAGSAWGHAGGKCGAGGHGMRMVVPRTAEEVVDVSMLSLGEVGEELQVRFASITFSLPFLSARIGIANWHP